jgi:isopentenyl-diphosphate delta-isomerase
MTSVGRSEKWARSPRTAPWVKGTGGFLPFYRLADPMSGLVEHKYNHVLVGHPLDSPLPDPAEVADIAMVTEAELDQMRQREPFAAWFKAVKHVAWTAAPALLAGLA